MENSELNPRDKYSVAYKIRDTAVYVIGHAQKVPWNNGTQDIGSRMIKELLDLGVSREILIQGICIFYRDYPEILNKVEFVSNEGNDYLRDLEKWVNEKD